MHPRFVPYLACRPTPSVQTLEPSHLLARQNFVIWVSSIRGANWRYCVISAKRQSCRATSTWHGHISVCTLLAESPEFYPRMPAWHYIATGRATLSMTFLQRTTVHVFYFTLHNAQTALDVSTRVGRVRSFKFAQFCLHDSCIEMPDAVCRLLVEHSNFVATISSLR